VPSWTKQIYEPPQHYNNTFTQEISVECGNRFKLSLSIPWKERIKIKNYACCAYQSIYVRNRQMHELSNPSHPLSINEGMTI
jgi:hypothetical protein